MSLKQGDVAVLNGAIVDGVIVEGAMRLTVDEISADGHVFGNDQHGNLMQFHATELTNVSDLALANAETAQDNADSTPSEPEPAVDPFAPTEAPETV